MTQSAPLTPGRAKKLIAFRPEQVKALDTIADDSGTTFTSTVLEAVDAYIAAHDSTTQQIVDRLVTKNSGLLERLKDA